LLEENERKVVERLQNTKKLQNNALLQLEMEIKLSELAANERIELKKQRNQNIRNYYKHELSVD